VAALCWDKALLMFLMVQDKTFRIVAAIALLFCHVWCWSNRSFTLTGLMIMVAIGRWASLKTLPKSDIFACRDTCNYHFT
jgi:hypothetical protein